MQLKTMSAMQGRVLLIASEAGLRVLPHMLHYSITKTAQIALAEVNPTV